MTSTMWSLRKSLAHLPIGLDLGASGGRLLQLQRSEVGWVVHRCVSWQRDLELQGGDEEEDAVERIARFVRQSGFSGRRTVTGLSAPDIELHPLDLPPTKDQIPEHQLVKAVNWEIQRLTTLDRTGLQTAMWTLPKAKRAKATYMGVAVLRSNIDTRLAECVSAGLNCMRVDVAPCALANLIWQLRGGPANQIWGILDLGYRHTRLIMCAEDCPVLARSFRLGGQGWTEHLATALNVSPEAAERYKRDHGLADHSPPATAAAGERLPELISTILRDDLQKLAMECERSYEYVLQCYAPRSPGDLILVGGGALLRGLPEFLSSRLGIHANRVSLCPSPQTASLVRDLPDTSSLEVCALACAYSLQGVPADAWR